MDYETKLRLKQQKPKTDPLTPAQQQALQDLTSALTPFAQELVVAIETGNPQAVIGAAVDAADIANDIYTLVTGKPLF